MESLARHLFCVLFRHTGTEPGVLFVLLCDHSLHCPTFYIRLPVIIHFLAVGPASRSEATVEEDRTGPCCGVALSLLDWLCWVFWAFWWSFTGLSCSWWDIAGWFLSPSKESWSQRCLHIGKQNTWSVDSITIIDNDAPEQIFFYI